jgi:hypothetical protein
MNMRKKEPVSLAVVQEGAQWIIRVNGRDLGTFDSQAENPDDCQERGVGPEYGRAPGSGI